MRLKYNLKISEVNGQYIAVAIGEDSHRHKDITFVNKVGKFILESLLQDIKRTDIIKNVINHFEGDRDIIKIEVNKFIDKLIELELIDSESL